MFMGYLFRVTFSPYGGESGYSRFDTFIDNGRLYITCLQKQIAEKKIKSRLCSINLIKIQ